MENDDLNLSMQNRDRLESKSCPNCGTLFKPTDIECPGCGIIFKKLQSRIAANPVKVINAGEEIQSKPTKQKESLLNNAAKFFPLIIIIVILALGSGVIYYKFIEGYIDAGNLKPYITKFCTVDIKDSHENNLSNNDDLFRTGKVLVVSPFQSVTLASMNTGRPVTMTQPAMIHPIWYKLKRSIRAGHPDDIDTLIRVYKKIGKSGRYGKLKTKIYNTHKIILEIYDWRNKKYIGTKVFDPGKGSSFMTDEDFKAMTKLTSNETIAQYIQALALGK